MHETRHGRHRLRHHVRRQRVGDGLRQTRHRARLCVRTARSRVHGTARRQRTPAVHHPVRTLARHQDLTVRSDRRRHPLLLLPPIAEPHTHHLLLQLQLVGELRDLRRRRLRLLQEVTLQGALHRHLDARPLLALATLRRDLVQTRRRSRRRVSLLQPFLQQRLQFTHVLEAQLQSLEAADGRLRENVAVESSQGQTDVGLRETEFDPSLFKLFRELFEVIGRGRFLVRVTTVHLRFEPVLGQVAKSVGLSGRRHESCH